MRQGSLFAICARSAASIRSFIHTCNICNSKEQLGLAQRYQGKHQRTKNYGGRSFHHRYHKTLLCDRVAGLVMNVEVFFSFILFTTGNFVAASITRLYADLQNGTLKFWVRMLYTTN